MTALSRLEAACANAVERTFAIIFPSALEPVQIARKLAATIERAPVLADPSVPRLYVVRVGAADFARLEPERTALERQWTKMALALHRRATASAAEVRVALVVDERLGRGAIRIESGEHRTVRGTPRTLQVESGPGQRATFDLPPASSTREVVLGREAGCDIVLADPRISRRHARLAVRGGTLAVEDLGSTNGTCLNGVRMEHANALVGDRLTFGDTTLVVEGEGAG